MNFNHLISHIQWIPVVVMTAFSFALGVIWHRPELFGKVWEKENNPGQVKKEINAPLIFGGTAVLHFIALSGLSAVTSGKGAIHGLLIGLFISLVWIFPAMGGTYLFANRANRLLAIDAGMYIVLFAISGLILGIW